MAIKISPTKPEATNMRSELGQCIIFINGAIMKKPDRKIKPEINQRIFFI
jgi:hypothetical protein